MNKHSIKNAVEMIKIETLVEAYNATNRIAFIHPRSKTVSLNGGRELPYRDAIVEMNNLLNLYR